MGLTAALAAAGCGGGDSQDTTASIQEPPPYKAPKLAEPAPKGSSLLLKEVYRQFQPPKADPKVAGSGKAIQAGEETCEGKTPAQITEAFLAQSELTEDQQKAVSELPRFEAHPSPSFPAGQVAALVYQQSLPEPVLGAYGFQGCVYQLSQGLKEDLAPKSEEAKK